MSVCSKHCGFVTHVIAILCGVAYCASWMFMETHSVSTVSIEDMPSQPQPILLPISRLVSTTLVLAFVAAPFLYAGVNVSMLSVAPTLSSISTVWDEHSKAMALEGSWTGTASTARTRREVSINRYVCVCVCVCVCTNVCQLPVCDEYCCSTGSTDQFYST